MNKKHISHKQQSGFTIIELLVFIAVITAVGLFVLSNIRSTRAQNRDSDRKNDINTLTYQLEKSYEANKFYPKELSTSTLKGVSEDSLKDDSGVQINSIGSQYQYKPSGCDKEKCKSYKLTAQLEKEAPYTKDSLR